MSSRKSSLTEEAVKHRIKKYLLYDSDNESTGVPNENDSSSSTHSRTDDTYEDSSDGIAFKCDKMILSCCYIFFLLFCR